MDSFPVVRKDSRLLFIHLCKQNGDHWNIFVCSLVKVCLPSLFIPTFCGQVGSWYLRSFIFSFFQHFLQQYRRHRIHSFTNTKHTTTLVAAVKKRGGRGDAASSGRCQFSPDSPSFCRGASNKNVYFRVAILGLFFFFFCSAAIWWTAKRGQTKRVETMIWAWCYSEWEEAGMEIKRRGSVFQLKGSSIIPLRRKTYSPSLFFRVLCRKKLHLNLNHLVLSSLLFQFFIPVQWNKTRMDLQMNFFLKIQ